MRVWVGIVISALLATPAAAVQIVDYGWEDGGVTIIGSYGNVADPTNVTGPQTGSQGSILPDYTCPGAQEGVRYLHFAEDPHG